MQYNWLMRRNKAISEELGKFSNDLHGYMMSGGQVKPRSPLPLRGRCRGHRHRRPTGGTGRADGARRPGAGPAPVRSAGHRAAPPGRLGGPSISKA
jgi:hypothetical protein